MGNVMEEEDKKRRYDENVRWLADKLEKITASFESSDRQDMSDMLSDQYDEMVEVMNKDLQGEYLVRAFILRITERTHTLMKKMPLNRVSIRMIPTSNKDRKLFEIANYDFKTLKWATDLSDNKGCIWGIDNLCIVMDAEFLPDKISSYLDSKVKK